MITTGDAAGNNTLGRLLRRHDRRQGRQRFMSGGDDGDIYIFGRGYGQDTIQDQQTNVLTQAADTVRSRPTSPSPTSSLPARRRDARHARLDQRHDRRCASSVSTTSSRPARSAAQAFDMIERFGWERRHGQDVEHALAGDHSRGQDPRRRRHHRHPLRRRDRWRPGQRRLEGRERLRHLHLRSRLRHRHSSSTTRTNILAGNADKIQFAAGIAPGDIDRRALWPIASGGAAFDCRNDGLPLDRRSVRLYHHQLSAPTRSRRSPLPTERCGRRPTCAFATSSSTRRPRRDTIEGFWSNDAIAGGAGNDILRGGDGADTYTFALGYGQDRIEENVCPRHLLPMRTWWSSAPASRPAITPGRPQRQRSRSCTFSGTTDSLTSRASSPRRMVRPAGRISRSSVSRTARSGPTRRCARSC